MLCLREKCWTKPNQCVKPAGWLLLLLVTKTEEGRTGGVSEVGQVRDFNLLVYLTVRRENYL